MKLPSKRMDCSVCSAYHLWTTRSWSFRAVIPVSGWLRHRESAEHLLHTQCGSNRDLRTLRTAPDVLGGIDATFGELARQ
jgi:hypothetical protein